MRIEEGVFTKKAEIVRKRSVEWLERGFGLVTGRITTRNAAPFF